MFPTWGSGSVYIQNLLTGNALDVLGGVKVRGRTVWPYALNFTNAQIFRCSELRIPDRYGDAARRIIAYPPGEDLVLSATSPPIVVAGGDHAGPAGTGTVRPDLVLPDDDRVVAGPDSRPSDRRILHNVVLTLEDERDLEPAGPLLPLDDLTALTGSPKQVWNLLPVDGEEDTFFLEGADFADSMVLEPLDLSSGGTLALSSFTGSDLQKWRIRRTRPPRPTDFRLSGFDWEADLEGDFYNPFSWHYEHFVTGRASWVNPDPAVVASQTLRISTSSGSESVTIGPDRTSLDFKVDSSESAKHQEHRLSISVRSRWQSENRSFSDEITRTPEDEPSDPGGGADPGVARVLIFNCHSDRAPIHLWTYDFTSNSGAWDDHGTLGEQWEGSGCPSGPPRTITLEDGHVYRLVAIDCGDLPPNQTQGSCHRLTTANLLGSDTGATISATVS